MDSKYLETAIILSRMYGVAETIQPLKNLEDEKFIPMIKEWTEEFLSMENGDLLKFFESKIGLIEIIPCDNENKFVIIMSDGRKYEIYVRQLQ